MDDRQIEGPRQSRRQGCRQIEDRRIDRRVREALRLRRRPVQRGRGGKQRAGLALGVELQRQQRLGRAADVGLGQSPVDRGARIGQQPAAADLVGAQQMVRLVGVLERRHQDRLTRHRRQADDQEPQRRRSRYADAQQEPAHRLARATVAWGARLDSPIHLLAQAPGAFNARDSRRRCRG
ncbi:MAG TPA: hypothetical protein VJY39_10275, partial [Acidisphaera sp.]|nr:hypothetical protein [Acidisphaera sp.]